MSSERGDSPRGSRPGPLVPVDWQGPVASYAQAKKAVAGMARQPGILQASATATAPFDGARHSGPGGSTSAGHGSVLAVQPHYLAHIKTFRLLQGSLRPGGVVLDQQLAATIQARIGDTVTLTPRPGAPPSPFKVTGVSLVTAPDVLFQPLNPLLGPAPAQPPSNVAVMPLDTFAKTLAPALKPITPASPGTSAVPGAQTGIQWQVQAQVNPAGLGSSPSQAYKRAGQTVHRVERSLPGQVQFVDNLSDQLNTAAGDALYAETLYIMLAVPGALVALGLAYLAALGTAFAAVKLLVSGGVGLTPGRGAVTAAACVVLAIAGAAAARIGATSSVWRASVAEGRRSVRREHKPLWERLYLDLLCLAVSGLIYWLTARTGFSAVVNPDSNPTLSLSVYMFFAPALLWIGATLLLVRLRGRLLGWLARRAAGDRAETRRGFLLASAGRRGGAINRGLIVVGLLLAFGVNLGIFTATYNQQANVDAQLTLGSDVTVTAPPGVAAKRNLPAKIAAVPGVRATTPVDHAYAYVGPDLQDTFGIDPNSITRATTLRDSYFLGGSASQMIQRLKARPDGILVSKETISDYSLRAGDLLKLRVLDHRTGNFRVVPFHVIGVVQEFPSAPRDSFMVANLNYLQQADHAGGPNMVFAKSSDPGPTSRRVATATKADGAIAKNIDEQAQQTVSSITTVDLRGISHIEEFFTIALAAAAMGLFVTLAVIERRREFATMAALGAKLSDVGGFVWSEAAIVLGAGLVLAAGLGFLLSEMLVAMLQHVFDPPPDHLAVPWAYLCGLAGAAMAGAILATALAAARLRRLPLGAILREQ